MQKITLNLLYLWKKTPNINPLTKRKIKINGPTFKKLQKHYLRLTKLKEIPITNNYIDFRKNKIDPILLIPLPLCEKTDKEIFSFKYKWNPYNGERSSQCDNNGPLCFDPSALIHYFYTNRLNHLWNKQHYDNTFNLIEGYYGDALGNGPDFDVVGRGKHSDWYLFRLPILDEYLHKDHCQQAVTMGPKLTDEEIQEIFTLSKKYGKHYKQTYGRRRPNIVKMKKIYEDAISKHEEIDVILHDSIPKEEIKIIKHNLCTEAINKLRLFR